MYVMQFRFNTRDKWRTVVGLRFETLKEAQEVFAGLDKSFDWCMAEEYTETVTRYRPTATKKATPSATNR